MDRPTVLVVDDDPMVTQMLEIIFDLHLEATVIAVQSPIEALRLFSIQPIALLPTDFLMPEMSGLDLLRAVRQGGFRIPVIILTGYFDMMAFVNIEENLAPYEIIVKPWDNGALIDRVKMLIGG
ncbi:MAG: response regulator [Methylacidiphilales bacterium]|nr:response regulator [Candidatus Methylacidiphilales bacterium]